MYHGHRAAYYVKAFLEGDRRPAALPHAVQDAPRAGRPGRALGGVRPRAPGVPRPRREPGRVPRDRVRPTTTRRRSERRHAATAATPRPARRTTASARARTSSSWRGRSRRTRASSARVFTKRLAVSNADAVPSRGGVARRHRLPAREPLAARDRPLPRRLPRRPPSSAAGPSSSPRRSSSPASTTRPTRCARPSRTASRRAGSPTSGRRAIGDGVPWLQLPSPARTRPTRERRRGHRRRTRTGSAPGAPPAPARDGQLLGARGATADLPEAIPFALEQGYDLLVLEARRRSEAVGRAAGAPDLSVHARRHPDPATR